MEKQMETTTGCWGNIGIIGGLGEGMDKKMETALVCWGSIGITEKKTDATV